MEDWDNLARVTRKQWAYAMVIGTGVLALNHWYSITSDRFFSIVVWGAPVVIFVGLVGLFRPNVTRVPKVTIGAATLGLVTGITLHHFLYGF